MRWTSAAGKWHDAADEWQATAENWQKTAAHWERVSGIWEARALAAEEQRRYPCPRTLRTAALRLRRAATGEFEADGPLSVRGAAIWDSAGALDPDDGDLFMVGRRRS